MKANKLFLIVALVVGLAACETQQGKEAQAQIQLAKANKQVVLDWANALNANDLAVLDKVLHKDFVDHNPLPGFTADKEGYIKTLTVAHEKWFPDIKVKVEEIVAEGDLVSFRVSVTATHTGEVMGAKPTGKKLAWQAYGLYRLKDGQLIERNELLDGVAFMGQLGLLPSGK